MHEQLINEFVRMIDSEAATAAAMIDPIKRSNMAMRAAVRKGDSVEAARQEGMISAFEQVYSNLSKFAAKYKVEKA